MIPMNPWSQWNEISQEFLNLELHLTRGIYFKGIPRLGEQNWFRELSSKEFQDLGSKIELGELNSKHSTTSGVNSNLEWSSKDFQELGSNFDLGN